MTIFAFQLGGWFFSAAAPAMLWGLVGLSIPVIIHFLNRRRTTVIDWGAMQFLQIGQRARRRFQLTELVLLLGRMALMGMIVFAMARPLAAPSATTAETSGTAVSNEPCDVVLVLDGSESMGRLAGGATPRKRALEWGASFVSGLPAGSSVSVLDAREQVRPLVVGSIDKERIRSALAQAGPPRAGSDLAAALAEALRLLESTRNTARDIIVLTDGQARAWRANEIARWQLIKDVHKSIFRVVAAAPRIWAVDFGSTDVGGGADGAVGPISVPAHLVPTGLPVSISARVTNHGPETLEREIALWLDGRMVVGSQQSIGPVPAGGQTLARFEATLGSPGPHVLSVRLSSGDDPLESNDAADYPIEAAEVLPVLLIDGDPGLDPLGGQTGFLRAALSPSGDETASVRARVVPLRSFRPEMARGQRVLVLADVAQLSPPQQQAAIDLLSQGGGVLALMGDKANESFYNDVLFDDGSGWFPARVGPMNGDQSAPAHPDPKSFTGPVMDGFRGGDDPPLGRAGLFGFRSLAPARDAAVSARLDTGDAWLIERPARGGRTAVLAGPLDAEGGTIAVNADFVPWIHTLIYHLASAEGSTRSVRSGETIVLNLPDDGEVEWPALVARTPDGQTRPVEQNRVAGRHQLRFDETGEAGLYRFERPGSAEVVALARVESDAGEHDPEHLSQEAAARISAGWPMVFRTSVSTRPEALLAHVGSSARPLWRWLVLAALLGLCLEVAATRRMTRSRGLSQGDS